jgi:hypothetical protein
VTDSPEDKDQAEEPPLTAFEIRMCEELKIPIGEYVRKYRYHRRSNNPESAE